MTSILLFLKKIPFKKEIIIILLALFCIYLNQQRVVQKDNYDRVLTNYIHRDSVEYDKNDLGNEVATSQVQEFKSSELKLLKEFDNLTKEFNNIKNNLRNVEQITEQKIILQTDTVTQLVRDTVIVNKVKSLGFTFDINNDYESIVGKVDVKNQKVEINSTQKIELKSVINWERKWFLGKKRYVIQTTSNNPNVKIEKNKLIKVKRK